MGEDDRNLRSCRTVLRSKGWLANQPEAFSSAMLSRIHVQRFRGGQAIYCQGDPARFLHAIVFGQVLLSTTTPQGKDLVQFIALPGDWIGERAAMRQLARPDNAVALNDTMIASISVDDVRAILSGAPAYYQCILDLSIKHLDIIVAFATEVLSQPSRPRILRILTILIEDWTKGSAEREIVVEIMQHHLAALARLSRQTTNTVLRQLARDGLIEIRQGVIIILDAHRLKDVADIA